MKLSLPLPLSVPHFVFFFMWPYDIHIDMSPYDFAHGIYGWMPHTPLLQPANSDILRCHFMLRTSAIPLKSPSLTLLHE